MNEYTFGKCLGCDENKALKNGRCAECDKRNDLPDCLKDIFGDFKNE